MRYRLLLLATAVAPSLAWACSLDDSGQNRTPADGQPEGGLPGGGQPSDGSGGFGASGEQLVRTALAQFETAAVSIVVVPLLGSTRHMALYLIISIKLKKKHTAPIIFSRD